VVNFLGMVGIAAVATLLAACSSSLGSTDEPASSSASSSAAAPAPGVMSVRVSGNQLVDEQGEPIRLVGVNFSGAQYACAEGLGFFDAPATDTSITALTSWGINAVRLPLNESCWLDINGVEDAFGGANNRDAIGDWVAKLGLRD